MSKRVRKAVKIPKSLIGIFLLGFSCGVGYTEYTGVGVWHSFNAEPDKINVCFTPPAGCGALLNQQLSQATSSIYVQAYTLTAEQTIKELIKAHQRGIKVKILLDQSNLDSTSSKLSLIKKNGIEVKIDKVSGIAHNKVIIIDNQKVLTGSYNYSENADRRNAENLLLIEDPQIAELYFQNWLNRFTQNTTFTP